MMRVCAIGLLGLLISAWALGLLLRTDSTALAAPNAPTAAGSDGRLVFDFTPTNDETTHVHVMSASGRRHLAITKGSSYRSTVAASPTGRWIAFQQELPGRKKVVRLIRPDGSDSKRLLPHARGNVLSYERPWSPDGKRLLVGKYVDGRLFIFLVNPDTGHERRLLAGLGREPAWSPDGKRLALVSDGRGSRAAITVFEVVTGRLRRIAVQRAGVSLGPLVWMRDSRRIVFYKGGSDSKNDGLFGVNADGSGERRLTTGRIADQLSPLGVSPANTILFSAYLPNEGIITVDVVNANGTGGRRTLFRQPKSPPPDYGSYCCLAPAWSPHGRRIAFVFHHPRRKELWVMNADGRDKRRLTTRGWVNNLSWLPAER